MGNPRIVNTFIQIILIGKDLDCLVHVRATKGHINLRSRGTRRIIFVPYEDLSIRFNPNGHGTAICRWSRQSQGVFVGASVIPLLKDYGFSLCRCDCHCGSIIVDHIYGNGRHC